MLELQNHRLRQSLISEVMVNREYELRSSKYYFIIDPDQSDGYLDLIEWKKCFNTTLSSLEMFEVSSQILGKI